MCDWKINSQTINVCNWHFHRKCLIEAPGLHKIIPARKPCVTNVLCNWEIDSKIIKCVCNHFGPHSRWVESPIANRWCSAKAANFRRPFRCSMWKEYYTNERQSRDSNRNTMNVGPMRTKFSVFGPTNSNRGDNCP